MDKMTFEQFTDAIVNNIKDYLPGGFADASVALQTITKNNDHKLTGLTIRSTSSNISPTIYLEQYCEEYKDGADIRNILSDIADVRLRHEVRDCFDIRQITDFGLVKDKIVPRLSSLEWNSDLLEIRPHTQIADLAVTYCIMLKADNTGVTSIPVTFQLMETWGVDVVTLHELAVRNLTRLFPTTFVSMSSMLRGLLPAIEEDDSSDGLIPQDDMMFILTSDQKLNGAANILDKAMMDSILERFGSDFYLLPSSIHEWILVSDKELNPSFLTSMVQEVNAGEVALEERLSSHVYRYTASEGLICA